MDTVGPPHKTLLVVEDNDASREGLAFVLRQEGFHVIPTANGQEAITHLRGGLRPDLILLDMLMPVCDGWQFLKWLQRAGPRPPAPVLIMTGTILTREWAEANGCQGFLHKPVEAGPLLAEVRRLCS
jgi:CheY-like chemotaxis protein